MACFRHLWAPRHVNPRIQVKWLNMKRDDLKNEKDEEYRLGYVAFSRAKRVLALACLEKIDFTELRKDIFEET